MSEIPIVGRGLLSAGTSNHPTKEDLRRFMAGELLREEVKEVVRHLLSGCPVCALETRRFWGFGARPPRPTGQPRQPRQVGVWQ